jgi:hypothetical protein
MTGGNDGTGGASGVMTSQKSNLAEPRFFDMAGIFIITAIERTLVWLVCSHIWKNVRENAAQEQSVGAIWKCLSKNVSAT